MRRADKCLLSKAGRAFSRSGEHRIFGTAFTSPNADRALIRPQMFIGDGAKLVRDAFALAKEKAPAIIFIDEIDAVGTKRFDSDKNGDREVQRTMLELLNQLDGFGSDERIKVRWPARNVFRLCLSIFIITFPPLPGHCRN